MDHDLHEIRERLDNLEEVNDEPHSGNLFANETDSRINLLQLELEGLKRNSQLELASSEINEWLNAKLIAFLESPEFVEKLKSDSKYRLTNWKILAKNLSVETRELLVSVS